MSDEGWTWRFRTPAKRAYDDFDEHAQDRILSEVTGNVDSSARADEIT